MAKIITKNKPQPKLSLRDFHDKRDKILIVRDTGGLGDILIHRMIFEDFKRIMPEAEIHFACPQRYHAVLEDHPFIDKILDSRSINPHDYTISYNTTSACCRHEMRMAPFSDKNRSDVWANHCGVLLSNHNMHMTLSDKIIKFGNDARDLVHKDKSKPAVLLCPISAMVSKDLQKGQMHGIVQGLRDMGCFVYSAHTFPIPELDEIGVPVIHGISMSRYLGIINSADYIISVDTASFHFAGGIGKPLTGIFTFADGKVYGRYYQFELVQKHRDNGNWDCGPCYNWGNCPKRKTNPKPCLTEITVEMLMDGVNRMFQRWPWCVK